MNFSDPSTAILAAAGGDTVKLFDVSAESSGVDSCILSYTPSPASHVNTLKWNHTNLVVASAGDDKKISLWRKNGQSMGTIPVAGTENADTFEESVVALSFSSKSSRYLCTGGSGQVVRIWDLQRKKCIKRLSGHTDTITGAMYNCKDEHLASISLSGDLIVHNLASRTRAADLKDPNGQMLRVLDYSRISRHLLVTAGDDGSVHLWDTTGRSPKISWLKQHSAPTAGVSFSPSNDKIIATVGLDKKLYTFDSGSRRPSFCISYETPFSSLAFRDDGNILAAGTNSGRVAFYDLRGSPQPLSVLRAYGNSEAVTSLCWQRSKPVLVNENCTDETALLGGAIEDSILMPDPLPSVTSSNASSYTAITGSRKPGRSNLSLDSLGSSTAEETPPRSALWAGGNLARLRPTRTHNFKDDMDVFSPLVDVQPITPSVDKLWDEHGGARKDLLADKKSSLLFPSSRRFPLPQEGGNDIHPLFDWKPSSTSKQDDSQSLQQPDSTPAASSKTGDSSSITPPEAWGGERISDKLAHHRQSVNLPSRFATLASNSLSSSFSGSQDLASSTKPTSISYLTSSSSTFTNLRHRDISESDTPLVLPEQVALSPTLSLGTRSMTGQSSFDTQGPALAFPRRFSTYAERISTAPAFTDGTSFSMSSPKTKKTGAETREELLNSFLLRSDAVPAIESGIPSSANGGVSQPQRVSSQPDLQQGSSFTLQLFQRSLEETLAPIQKAFHDDMRNLHIEVLRQAHMQQMEYSGTLNLILENQAADYCTICLLGAMDRLWFHQIILFSEPNTTLMLSNNLKIPEQPNTLVSTYPPSDALPDEISSAYKSYATPSELDEFNQEDEEAEDYKKSEITRSNSLLSSDRTRPKTMSRSSYSGPMIRLQKTMSCKTLSELELEEVKGFIDLGFKFSRDNLSPITMSIVPGLQRMGRPKKDKAQDEARFDGDDIYEEDADLDEDELGENDRGVMRPYLSEAWLIQSANSHLLNLKLPRAYATADMKKHLRYWARTVASVIQLES